MAKKKQKKYIVAQVWVRMVEVEAKDNIEAYEKGEPSQREVDQLRDIGLNFSNWHIEGT